MNGFLENDISSFDEGDGDEFAFSFFYGYELTMA